MPPFTPPRLGLYGRWDYNREPHDEVADIALFFADRTEAVAQEVTQLQSKLAATDDALRGERRALLALLRGLQAHAPARDLMDDLDPLRAPASDASLAALTRLTDGAARVWCLGVSQMRRLCVAGRAAGHHRRAVAAAHVDLRAQPADARGSP